MGDIVLDRSAFDVPGSNPGRFRGEPLRPYNASPDALLLNHKSSVMTFVPDACRVCPIQYDRHWLGCSAQPRWLALPGQTAATGAGPCARIERPAQRGRGLPAACGEQGPGPWPTSAPREFAARAVEGMWRGWGQAHRQRA